MADVKGWQHSERFIMKNVYIYILVYYILFNEFQAQCP